MAETLLDIMARIHPGLSKEQEELERRLAEEWFGRIRMDPGFTGLPSEFLGIPPAPMPEPDWMKELIRQAESRPPPETRGIWQYMSTPNPKREPYAWEDPFATVGSAGQVGTTALEMADHLFGGDLVRFIMNLPAASMPETDIQYEQPAGTLRDVLGNTSEQLMTGFPLPVGTPENWPEAPTAPMPPEQARELLPFLAENALYIPAAGVMGAGARGIISQSQKVPFNQLVQQAQKQLASTGGFARMKEGKPTMPQSALGEAFEALSPTGVSSRSASPFETSIERSDPYVNKIRSSVETKAIEVPHEVQINRFRTGTATYKINIDPKLIAARGDQEAPFVLSDWRQAREINASPERVSGWHNNIYPEAELTESWEKARRAPSTGGKLKDLEVMQLTQGCQRSATTVERVQHGILPAETKIEACYGGECWANWTMASKFGKFENMDVKNLKIASPDAIEKWFAGKAGQQRVALMNKSPFIRQGYSGCDSHAIATGVAEKWLEESVKAGVKPKTVFISAGYAPVTKEQYRSLAKYGQNFELHISNSGWFDKNEIMLRFGEFMEAREAGVPVKMRIITNADEVAGVKMTNEQFLDDLMKQHGIRQEEILETPFHDDSVTPHKYSDATGKYKYVCCTTGKCGSCPYKCMTKVNPDTLSAIGASVATTGVLAGGNGNTDR